MVVPGLKKEVSSLVEVARQRALSEPRRRAYHFLEYHSNGEKTTSHLTYEQLDAGARSVAAALRSVAAAGDRALLLYRPGLDFVCGFLGCLYGGIVAVPAAIPRHGRGIDRLKAMMSDSDASVVLSTTSVRRTVEALVETRSGLEWVFSDEVDAVGPEAIEVGGSDLAFLQYSSGSTGSPKGIRVGHENLMVQSGLLHAAMKGRRDGCLVSWLPIFHDLGLIGGVLQPLFGGYPGVLMAPEAFLASPGRWLEAISDHRADIGMAPDFAYEMCVQRIAPEMLDGVDLSCWRVALNGAEPVRSGTIDGFSKAFAGCGFRREAFLPAYGLAEATLMVTGSRRGRGPTQKCFSATALEENKVVGVDPNDSSARWLVGCGGPVPGHRVVIVDPVNSRPVDGVGEIWVAGDCVGAGYWGRIEESRECFEARLATTGEGPFLRTGDLGFFADGELFVCGRLKDLIIIRGGNFHAPDVELTVERAHSGLRPSCGAAFSVDVDDEERLVVVQEVDRSSQLSSPGAYEQAIGAIRRAITEEHEIQVHAVVLLRHGTMPKTSSGKIQRRACRTRYLEGRLKAVAAWSATALPGREPRAAKEERPELASELEKWLVGEIVTLLGCEPEAVRADRPLNELDLSSDDKVNLSRIATMRFGTPIPPTLFTDFPNLESLIDHAAGVIAEGRARRGMPLASRASWVPSPPTSEPIALIGIGCRFPGAAGPHEFWKLLCDGVDAITEVPPERWDIEELYDPNPLAKAKMSTRCGGFLQDIDLLDREFFGLSIREAVRMDPQHRLMLEVAWEALADAGQVLDELEGVPVGVYVGISGSDYAQGQFGDPKLVDAYAGLGCALTIAASRISYSLNLCGPALAVDTACSSSLSAVHLACSSLWRGECTMALAGGVNVLLAPTVTMCLSKAGMMSPDGRCKAFDARANGYVRSEGAGIVVLKPLTRALADGDPIYAVIRGTASNQDGRSSGIAAPNGEAQQNVILSACRHAGISPGQLDYVEAHGTGTALGDPIEVNALGEVLTIDRPAATRCAIGSVKSNIGHAESAAGIASIVKTALILKHRRIPPSLHFEQPNPLIPFDRLPVEVQTSLGPLPERSRPVLAGVNSFGVGGTNVHIILEEAPPRRESGDRAALDELQPVRPWVLPLSAKSDASLASNARAVAELMRRPEAADLLADACYTASRRRGHMDHRLAVSGASAAGIADALEAHLDEGHHPAVASGRVPAHLSDELKVAFVFSGQGSQWWGMGRGLLESEPTFKLVIEECDALLRTWTGWSLMDQFKVDERASRLDETEFAQPAIFALQVGLAELWRSWGVVPDMVAGHSVGEVAAAHVSGRLSLSDATRLIARRAKLMQRATGLGQMASIELSSDELEPILADYSDRLAVAAVNGPRSVVLSGESAALRAVIETLEARDVVTVTLPVNYAFHSPQMEPFAAQLSEDLRDLQPTPARLPMFSTVTAEDCDGHVLDGDYWGSNVRRPVLFAPTVDAMAEAGGRIFVEIGPHPVISGVITRTLRSAGARGAVLSSLRRDEDEQGSMLMALGALHAEGGAVDWGSLYPRGEVCQELPAYRWNRQRYWLEGIQKKARRKATHPLLGDRLTVAQPVWQNELEPESVPFARDFRVKTRSSLPGGLLTEIALGAAGEGSADGTPFELTDVSFQEAADLGPGEEALTLQATASTDSEGGRTVRVFSERDASPSAAGGWRLHLTARTVATGADAPRPLALDEIAGRCGAALEGGELYRKLEEAGIHYGPSLRAVESVRRGEAEVLARIRLPEPDEKERYRAHPALLEAAALACRLAHSSERTGWLELEGFERVRVLRPCGEVVNAYVRLRPAREHGDHLPRCDVRISEESGEILAELAGVRFGPSRDRAQLVVPTDHEDWLYEVNWRPREREQERPAAREGQGSWLVFADRAGVGRGLADRLASHGQRCVTVRPGTAFERLAENDFAVRPASLEDMERLMTEALNEDEPACRGIVHLWSTDAGSEEEPTAASIADDQTLGSISIVHVLRALGGVALARSPRLWLVTRGAQAVTPEAEPIALSQATVWGLGKVVVMEQPEVRCCRVDLGPAGGTAADDAASLFDECWADDREDQVALRGEKRYVARLERFVPGGGAPSEATEPGPEGLAIPADEPFRLGLETPGEPDSLAVFGAARRVPAPGEVEIRVVSAGLGWKDAAAPSGLPEAKGPAAWIGDGCAGTVVRLGPGVRGLEEGQEVLALAPGCLTSYLTVSAAAVVAKPAELGFDEGAGWLPGAAAATYALREIARLDEGQRLLVHSAGSAAGAAAVRLARSLGAVVLATCRDDRERELLTSSGADHVLDAHSLLLLSQVMELTEGGGLDVVLNCVAGWDLAHGLKMLRPFGRCIDAAKTESGRGAETRGLRLENNVSVHEVDLEQLCRERPAALSALLREVAAGFADGGLGGRRVESFPAERTADALRSLEAGGRVAIRLPLAAEGAAAAPSAFIRPDASYLVTGGLGGLGMGVASRFVQRGARHLVLVGRSRPSAAAQRSLERFREQGVECRVVSLDVADEGQVRDLLGMIEKSMPPLRGIVHAAGVLANGLLAQLDEERFRAVMPSKVTGSWHLHSLSAGAPLDFFVMFSSLASLIGSPGQGNYAAANAFLDGLAAYRIAKGLPALAVAWGPWDEIGMAADVHNKAWLEEQGMGMLRPETALDLFERLVQYESGVVGAIAMNWRLWGQSYAAAAGAPFVSSLMPDDLRRSRGSFGLLTAQELEGLEVESRLERLEETVHEVVCQTLQLDADSLPTDLSLSAVGLDSIVALELKNRLEARIDIVVQTPSLLKGPTIRQLCEQFLALLSLASSGDETDAEGLAEGRLDEAADGELEAAEAERMLEQLNELSDEEVSSALSRMAEEHAR